MYAGIKAMREAFGDALVDLGAENEKIVVLTADLTDAVKVTGFKKAYPERFFQMGIKESDMIGTAAGMAVDGLVPFATTFAVFATSLANQAVRVSVGYNQANVKIATSHGGMCVGADGATHQSFEDIALMRLIPGMTVMVPCDANEAYKATRAAAAMNGPVYLRLGRIPTPVITSAETHYVPGQAAVLRDGRDVAIIAAGMMVSTALDAADRLAREGISARIINMHTIKPLDEDAVRRAAGECGCLVTAEEHSVIGGLGSACADLLVRKSPVPLAMVGVQDTFGESGEPEEILKKYGLTSSDICENVRLVLSKKNRRDL
ncbi:transketolase C-terminal domain-containing protein [Marispirochaeta sp.]|uniref:transketolase family protein n=1 Tax=Marispirochaeta sp. TaxID=2038653 RepID=UPI0029C85957|nr:transketolase C-terminal domain-containing protein [Marispirochaeta sp.]